ncbi:MAG: shikimate dehydrogenase [Bacteroidota bacterium]
MINRQLGLIGYPLSHSFSKKYFSKKFLEEKIEGYHYELYPIPTIADIKDLIVSQENLFGLNVTIPYKQQVLPFLNEISEEAAAIGAVNTIKIKNGQLKGFNTDVYGFEISLRKLLASVKRPFTEMNALILGTGGASKAVAYVLDKLEIKYQLVSRNAGEGRIAYQEIDKECLQSHQLLVNTTPLGTAPNVNTMPNLPYQHLTSEHFLYDLVYNPKVTKFLKMGLNCGAATMNGLEMLHLQAEKAWRIWTDNSL